jgi:hypothetical protein
LEAQELSVDAMANPRIAVSRKRLVFIINLFVEGENFLPIYTCCIVSNIVNYQTRIHRILGLTEEPPLLALLTNFTP